MHKLSITTINLNNLTSLQETMQSVFEQNYSGFEYTIIDGGSQDGSKDYILLHSDKLAYWASKKDNRIFEAIIKGIRKFKREYTIFLYSGDYLHDTNVLYKFFSPAKNQDIIYGNVI